MERRLRPPHDQALKCPRCDSTHTKFCYYNNYSLSQPRYFCKTCRRYWTKGGTLRNIPVGGGCRKNKKASSSSSSANSKKSNDHHHPIIHNHQTPGSSSSSHHTPTDLQLSFPADQVQFSHLTHLLGPHQVGLGNGNPSFMERNYNAVFENPRPIDFMEREYESLVGGSSRNQEFMGNCELGMMGGGIGEMSHGLAPNFHFQSLYSPFGMALDGNNGGDGPFMDNTCQRLMLPYDHQVNDQDQDQNTVDVKPNTKILSLEWKDQGCSDAGKDSYGSSSLNGLGSWTGFMNTYGTSSTTNPLV
ncbi:hypothetical protein U1Q18_007272 [Sarracenia purpurea var. burkii]